MAATRMPLSRSILPALRARLMSSNFLNPSLSLWPDPQYGRPFWSYPPFYQRYTKSRCMMGVNVLFSSSAQSYTYIQITWDNFGPGFVFLVKRGMIYMESGTLRFSYKQPLYKQLG